MRIVGLVVAGLVGVGILTYLCGSHHGPHFAADLSAKSMAAFQTAGIDGVLAAGEGQVITLTGQVASEEIRARAEQRTRAIDGVEDVRNLLTVAPPPPPPPPTPVAPAVLTGVQRTEAVNCQKLFNRLLGAEKIRFETGKANINKASHRLLDRLAQTAGKCEAAQIRVEGHTDSRGKRDMNLRLSRERAEAVVRYLTAKGVAATRLTAEGLGPDKPVGSNKTAAGRERNRRTEFKVQGL